MATVAKFGLCLDQQLALFLGVMLAVAIEAAYVIAGVNGRAKVLLLVGLTMALETAPAGFRTRQSCEADDLGLVAARHMLGARTVAGFTAVTILLESLKMGRAFEVLFVNVLVASQANVRAGILRRSGRLTMLIFFVGGHSGR